MKITRRASIGILFVVLFSAWWGAPAVNKWRADRLVDEMCAKDVGVSVHEKVTLPKERFNQWGQFVVRGADFIRPSDEYYIAYSTTDIIGKHASSDISKLTVYRHHLRLHRIADKKILGEAIGYARSGGDPIGPWHPSSYSCPGGLENKLTAQIFEMAGNQ